MKEKAEPVTIKVLRPFYIDGKVADKGKTLSVSPSVAAELVQMNKAEAVSEPVKADTKK